MQSELECLGVLLCVSHSPSFLRFWGSLDGDVVQKVGSLPSPLVDACQHGQSQRCRRPSAHSLAYPTAAREEIVAQGRNKNFFERKTRKKNVARLGLSCLSSTGLPPHLYGASMLPKQPSPTVHLSFHKCRFLTVHLTSHSLPFSQRFRESIFGGKRPSTDSRTSSRERWVDLHLDICAPFAFFAPLHIDSVFVRIVCNCAT